MDCWTCRSITGEERISPGPTIYNGKYWIVEHAFPINVLGWLVIVLKRHIEALHNLSSEEFRELSEIESRLIPILFQETNCEKEYVSCYAEKDHFTHIHFHIFAKPKDLPNEYKGAKSFAFINPSESDVIPSESIIEFCKIIGRRMEE
jgi:diadenosine tetraphosphate (Ap4A) HIT family hydrolase